MVRPVIGRSDAGKRGRRLYPYPLGFTIKPNPKDFVGDQPAAIFDAVNEEMSMVVAKQILSLIKGKMDRADYQGAPKNVKTTTNAILAARQRLSSKIGTTGGSKPTRHTLWYPPGKVVDHKKPLRRNDDLYNAVQIHKISDTVVGVGIHHNAVALNGYPLGQIAAIHAHGVTITVTRKMAMFFALLRKTVRKTLKNKRAFRTDKDRVRFRNIVMTRGGNLRIPTPRVGSDEDGDVPVPKAGGKIVIPKRDIREGVISFFAKKPAAYAIVRKNLLDIVGRHVKKGVRNIAGSGGSGSPPSPGGPRGPRR